MLRTIFIILFVVIVLIEGYYIVVLRSKIDKKTEETKNISIELQFLKNEKDNLYEELNSAKKIAGEDRNGNTPER